MVEYGIKLINQVITMSVAKLEVSFTSAVPSEQVALNSDFNLSLDFSTGSGVGTVELQRSFDDGVTWETTDTISSDTENNGLAVGNLVWRLNCTAFTSGTIAGRLEQ